MVTDDHSRGQIILIGAIALAFIILGVVVVFNGVLYTETLSSGSSSQTASTADVTTTEVEQSVGCLLTVLNDEYSPVEDSDRSTIASDIEPLGDNYRATNARSTPAVTDLAVEEDDIEVDNTNERVEYADVTVTFDSHDLSYQREQEIKPEDCPDDDL